MRASVDACNVALRWTRVAFKSLVSGLVLSLDAAFVVVRCHGCSVSFYRRVRQRSTSVPPNVHPVGMGVTSGNRPSAFLAKKKRCWVCSTQHRTLFRVLSVKLLSDSAN